MLLLCLRKPFLQQLQSRISKAFSAVSGRVTFDDTKQSLLADLKIKEREWMLRTLKAHYDPHVSRLNQLLKQRYDISVPSSWIG